MKKKRWLSRLCELTSLQLSLRETFLIAAFAAVSICWIVDRDSINKELVPLRNYYEKNSGSGRYSLEETITSEMVEWYEAEKKKKKALKARGPILNTVVKKKSKREIVNENVEKTKNRLDRKIKDFFIGIFR